jgi:hypothetical protein
LNADRLDFVHNFVFPPSHVELLPARELGYKTRRKTAAQGAGARDETIPMQAGFKFEPDFDRVGASGYNDASMTDTP